MYATKNLPFRTCNSILLGWWELTDKLLEQKEKYWIIRFTLDRYDEKKHKGQPITIKFNDDGTFQIISEQKWHTIYVEYVILYGMIHMIQDVIVPIVDHLHNMILRYLRKWDWWNKNDVKDRWYNCVTKKQNNLDRRKI